ncbi:uncharacterized protein N7515_007612 [Penicillium bovifimosum]|uniref:CRAL-TRIO domain-containing protein n=1 Tax=Penicillium bovifimosum TaxID=126998 RepID=A0A9W9GXC6_9EURO|nr:uncharacterized protein N7515_007612 [Penicillium bovifimosum]KAJ5131573.1 hypothetical protein N7515_007612 [Penicillium bovifimosum]
MAANGPKPGYLGNLNKDQEASLQKLWSVLIKAGESSLSNEPSNEPASPAPVQKRRSLLGRAQSNVSGTIAASTTPYQQHILKYLGEMGAGAPECDAVKKLLSQLSGAELQTGVLDFMKHEHPDSLLLRYLRARKWDVPKAFAMMINTVVWRVKEAKVDEDVMAKGELHALQQIENKSSPSEQKAGIDFLSQMRMGKSYVHGVDRTGRPVAVIRARRHQPGAQTDESLERYVVHAIETIRMVLVPPVETAAIVFDLTGFALSNMEYPVVKFILKSFEAYYPETLGVMIFHNAPWVFSGIWRLIRGWMVPEIAAKVQFTNNVDDLDKLIARDQIVEEVGGDEKWTYEFVEPRPDENPKMNDTVTRDALKAERRSIGDEFLAATAAWIDAAKANDPTKLQSSESERAYLAERLRVNYWKLDPYTRARSQLDREGVIQAGGKIDFYPKEVPAESQVEEVKSLDVHHLEQVSQSEAQTVF